MKIQNNWKYNKVGCVFPMIAVSILSHAEFGQNDHREDALHISFSCWNRIHSELRYLWWKFCLLVMTGAKLMFAILFSFLLHWSLFSLQVSFIKTSLQVRLQVQVSYAEWQKPLAAHWSISTHILTLAASLKPARQQEVNRIDQNHFLVISYDS